MIQKAVFLNELLNDTKCPPLIDVRSEECCHIRNFIMKSGLEKNNRVGPDKKQCRRNTYWHSPYILNIEYIIYIIYCIYCKNQSSDLQHLLPKVSKSFEASHQIQQKIYYIYWYSKAYNFASVNLVNILVILINLENMLVNLVIILVILKFSVPFLICPPGKSHRQATMSFAKFLLRKYSENLLSESLMKIPCYKWIYLEKYLYWVK